MPDSGRPAAPPSIFKLQVWICAQSSCVLTDDVRPLSRKFLILNINCNIRYKMVIIKRGRGFSRNFFFLPKLFCSPILSVEIEPKPPLSEQVKGWISQRSLKELKEPNLIYVSVYKVIIVLTFSTERYFETPNTDKQSGISIKFSTYKVSNFSISLFALSELPLVLHSRRETRISLFVRFSFSWQERRSLSHFIYQLV